MNHQTLKSIGEAKESLICLRYTKTFDEEALREPKWIECKALYGECTNQIQKAVMSIYNALQYHNRQIICITRDLTLSLIRSDKNHEKNGIRNEKWSEIMRVLFDSGILKVISQEKSKPWIVEVIDQDLLKYMKSKPRDEQLTECVSFVNKEKNFIGDELGDGLGDGLGDVVRRRRRSTDANLSTKKEGGAIADAAHPVLSFSEKSSTSERSKGENITLAHDTAHHKNADEDLLKRSIEEEKNRDPFHSLFRRT